MRRPHGLISPLLVLPMILLGCIDIGCSSQTRTTFVTNMKGKATRTDAVDLALTPADTLVLVGDYENLEVRSTSRAPRIKAEITVIAYTQKEAEKALSAFHVVTRRTSRGLEVQVVGDAGTYETESGRKVPYSAFTDFTATVSDDVKIIAEGKSGDIGIRGD